MFLLNMTLPPPLTFSDRNMMPSIVSMSSFHDQRTPALSYVQQVRTHVHSSRESWVRTYRRVRGFQLALVRYWIEREIDHKKEATALIIKNNQIGSGGIRSFELTTNMALCLPTRTTCARTPTRRADSLGLATDATQRLGGSGWSIPASTRPQLNRRHPKYYYWTLRGCTAQVRTNSQASKTNNSDNSYHTKEGWEPEIDTDVLVNFVTIWFLYNLHWTAASHSCSFFFCPLWIHHISQKNLYIFGSIITGDAFGSGARYEGIKIGRWRQRSIYVQN